MATTVVKTIGTGGDYTTLQAWEDACPANLVTADQVWQGQLKNQVFSGSTRLLNISGTTVDATRYVELTTEAGASFLDHASVRTNALRYNEGNGASVVSSVYGSTVVEVSQNYTRINKIQFSSTLNGIGAFPTVGVSADYCNIDRCIVEGFSRTTSGVYGVLHIYGSVNRLRNSLVVQKTSFTNACIAGVSAGTNAYNTTFVSIGTTTTYGVRGMYLSSTLRNCYVGGCINVTSGSTTYTKENSFTDVSGPPSGWSAAPLSTATFENLTPGSHDFRLKSGAALVDAGVTDATYAANDISNLARSGTWDVGAWETSGGGGVNATATGATLTGTASLSPGAATASGTAPGVTLTGTASLTAGAASASAAGVITIPACRDWGTGNIKAGETGVQVDIRNISTGALVVRKTGQTTHGTTGVCVVSDALIIPAATYEVMTRFTDGSIGVWDYTAT